MQRSNSVPRGGARISFAYAAVVLGLGFSSLGCGERGAGSGGRQAAHEVELVASNAEVDEGAGSYALQVRVVGAAPRRELVLAFDVGGSLDDADYTLPSASLVIGAGATSGTLEVDLTDDAVHEDDESLILTLRATPPVAVRGDATFTLSVRDDDAPPVLSVLGATVAESGGTAQVAVSVVGVSEDTVSVTYATEAGGASTGADFAATTGTLEVPPGEHGFVIEVPVMDDTLDEDDESFTVRFSSPQGASLSGDAALVTIVDDDPSVFPEVAIDDVQTSEGNDALFTITLAQPGSRAVTVAWSTAVNSADGSDFEQAAGTATFMLGETVKTIAIATRDDLLIESAEVFFLELLSATHAVLADARGTATVLDTDGAPQLTLSGVVVTEEAASARLEVTLSSVSGNVVTVNFATVAVSATADSDYTQTSGTLSFAPGQTSAFIDVPLLDDDVAELLEVFAVELSGATNATLANAAADVTLLDDDALVDVNIADASAAEGQPLTYVVSLSQASANPVTVECSVASTSPLSTAVPGVDYSEFAATTLTFAAGETSKTVTISTLNDSTSDGTKRLSLVLGSPSASATVVDGRADGLIFDVDARPTVSIDDATAPEFAQTLSFTVSLSHPSGLPIDVDFVVGGGTATRDDDYSLATMSPLRFAPGETSKAVVVDLAAGGHDDSAVEGSETFTVTLSAASADALLCDAPDPCAGDGTIVDDDDGATIVSVSSEAGSETSASLSFTVSLSHPNSSAVEVTFGVGGGNAALGTDYSVATASPITFAPGEVAKTLLVNLAAAGHNDATIEGTETFVLTLSGATGGATLCNGPDPCTGTGTILDDDVMPTIDIDDVARSELDATMVFTVTLSSASGSTVTVDYAPVASATNPATLGADYDLLGGTLTFAPGETSKVVTVTLGTAHDDTVNEGTEHFEVELTTPTGGALLCGTPCRGVGTVLDDEAVPTASITDASRGEQGGVMVFDVTLSVASGADITLDYETVDGPAGAGGAVAGEDYVGQTGSLSFAAGQLAGQISVVISNDPTPEQTERFFVDLALAAGSALLPDPRGEGTLLDNDTLVGVSIADASAAEGQALTYVVSLSQASANLVTVQCAVASTTPLSTAVSGVDYSAFAPTTLSFAAGETSKSVMISTLSDSTSDGTKRLSLTLGSPSASATVVDGRADGLIFDVDAIPILSVDDVTLSEAATAPDDLFVFTVSLSTASGNTVTVQAATSNFTATAPDDYVAIAPALTLSFAPGVTTQTLVVPVLDDALPEQEERFRLTLTAPTGGATLCGSPCRAFGIILDDERAPDLAIDDVAQGEGSTAFSFNVTLSFASGDTITIDWATADDTATTLASDYAGVSATTLTFAPGVVTLPVTVTVNNDDAPEATESFFVVLSGVTGNATLLDDQGQGTIYDDDTTVGVSLGDATAREGEALRYTATLSQTSGNTITVDYAVSEADSTAVPGVDYAPLPPGPFIFPPGQLTATLLVPTVDDGVPDGAKRLHIDLANASTGASITDARGTGTIADANARPVLISAFTRDLDGNGGIDHYRLLFDGAVDEASFPGYSSATALGSSAQTDWLVAGHGSVQLVPSGLSPEADTATDELVYLRLTESDGPDTGEVPELTTSAMPGLSSLRGDELAPIDGSFDGERDGAVPVLLRASSDTGLTELRLFFSEPVFGGAVCPGGALQVAGAGRHIAYLDASQGGVSDLDNSGDLDGADGTIVPSTAFGVPFAEGDVGVDSVAPAPNAIRDVACNAVGTRSVPVSFTRHPTVLRVSSASEDTVRIEFSEDVDAAQATQSSSYSLLEESGVCQGTPVLGATITQVSGSVYELSTGVQDNGCVYRLTVTGPIVDVDENAALRPPTFGTFVGQQQLRVLSAQATSLREVVITFSKPVLDTGPGGADDVGMYTAAAALGPVVAAQRLASDTRKVKLTHTEDQGGAFYSLVVSTNLRAATCTGACPEILLSVPFDRTTFQGLGGQVTALEQGPLFIDPFGDGTSFAYVFRHQGYVYAGPNDDNSSVFRFEPDAENAVAVTFAVDSGLGAPPYSTFGNNLERPATRVTSPSVGVTRYYLTPDTNLSSFSAGDTVTVTNCLAVDNLAAATLSDVSDAGDWIELDDGTVAPTDGEPLASPISPGPEACAVAIHNDAGPRSYDGVDTFVAASITGPAAGEYVLFGAHELGAGSFSEIHFTTDQDALLDTTYCNIDAVTLGNSSSLQMFYGHGDYVYMGMVSSNAAAPVLAYFQPRWANSPGDPGADDDVCFDLSDAVAPGGKGAKFIDYLGINGSPKNLASIVGIDSIVVFDDGQGPQLYIANNGGIARTLSIPPGSAPWSVVRHDFTESDPSNSWPSGTTTQAIATSGKLRPGEKGVPLMVPWNGALYVGRNRTDDAAELWRYNFADGWSQLIDTATSPFVDATSTDLSLLVVNGDNLYVGFDSDFGVTVWRITDSSTTILTSLNFFAVGEQGLGPLGGTDLHNNKHILSHVSLPFGGADYLYLTVGCVSDFSDDGACDRRTPGAGRTDFAIRLFRQVD